MGRVREVLNADCLEAMRSMGDCTFDAVVTDPPYGLSFMGKEWDTFARMQEWFTPVFSEILRVSKPGAYLLCFGGTRTFHRMACAIEDAGWEIRDCIMWVYGSGFPKSMDIAKAIDKASGYVGEVIGERTVDVGMQGGHMHAGRKQQQQQQQVRALSEDAAKWDGWGTALKPAWEPIIVARKPLDGTVASNVMEHGTGALNIDACRVPTGDKLGGGMRGGGSDGWDRPWMHDEDKQASFVAEKMLRVEKAEEMGRFPANLAHDGSEEVLELFPQSDGQQGKVSGLEPSRIGDNGIYGHYSAGVASIPRGDSGSAARFFYCAKASAQDRGDGNDHPTVKPNELMRWLVRLVCRKDGIVLDPFCGSGSTGVACVNEGMSFIGIDQDEHYCGIARRRIEDALPHQQRLF